MIHETESGRWPSMQNDSKGGAIQAFLDASVNKALPWFVILVIAFGMVVYIQQSRISALNDRISASESSLNNRVGAMSDRISEIDSKANAATASAFDAKTQSLLAGDHIRELRESMAAHGITPLPKFPKRLE